MEIVTHLTVENRIKKGELKLEIPNPDTWLWAYINDIWQPLFQVYNGTN